MTAVLLISQQVESVTSRLTQSSRLLQQLESEREMLNARIGSLEDQLSREQAERENEMVKAEERLRQVTSDFDSALSELESTQTTNLLLQQKVGVAIAIALRSHANHVTIVCRCLGVRLGIGDGWSEGAVG